MLEITEHDKIYWQYEYDVVAKHLLPLLNEWGFNLNGKTLLDVGCGDGGGVSAFYDAGFVCKGFDIETRRVELANAMRQGRNFEMLYGNIYDDAFPYSNEQFDLIVLHDVFEHLEKKELVLEKLKSCLKSDGRILITFPPYYSAFGAHQQLLKSKMGKFPFFHLLPFSIPFLIDKFPNEDVAIYFSAADVVVLPYISATQSGIAQIAYNFDKPVIATDVVGLREVIVDGKTGYIVPPNDPKTLADAITKFYSGNKEKEFSENVKLEKQKYSWDSFVETIEELVR